MAESIDATDWAILAALQEDGRLPLTELGSRVNLSASATTDRVKRLESLGVITGYRAAVDLKAVGYPVLAVVRLKFPGNQHQPLHELIRDRPEILECLRTTGDDCYVLKLAATYMGTWRSSSTSSPELGSTTTNVVYRETQPFRGPASRGQTVAAEAARLTAPPRRRERVVVDV